MGASLADIHAVVLTHSHLDHVGVMARIKDEACAEIFVNRRARRLTCGSASFSLPL